MTPQGRRSEEAWISLRDDECEIQFAGRLVMSRESRHTRTEVLVSPARTVAVVSRSCKAGVPLMSFHMFADVLDVSSEFAAKRGISVDDLFAIRTTAA